MKTVVYIIEFGENGAQGKYVALNGNRQRMLYTTGNRSLIVEGKKRASDAASYNQYPCVNRQMISIKIVFF